MADGLCKALKINGNLLKSYIFWKQSSLLYSQSVANIMENPLLEWYSIYFSRFAEFPPPENTWNSSGITQGIREVLLRSYFDV